MTYAQMKHFLFVPLGLWGHVRPMITLLAGILQRFPDVQVTMIVGHAYRGLSESEFGRYKLSASQRERLRLAECRGSVDADHAAEDFKFGFGVYHEDRKTTPGYLREVYSAVLKGDGEFFQAPLTAVIIDMAFLGLNLIVMRKVEEDLGISRSDAPKRLVFTPLHPASHAVMHFDHANPPVIKEVVDRIGIGEDPDAAFSEVVLDGNALVQVPDCAPMYAYELDGRTSYKKLLTSSVIPFRQCLVELDGVLSATPPNMCSDTVRMTAQDGIALFAVGPLIGPARSSEALAAANAGEVLSWLDKAVENHGSKSVAYVCFGSVGFAPDKDQVVLLMRALVDRKKPALIVAGAADEAIRNNLQAEAEKAPKGLINIVSKAPQQAVLAHSATGFFVSHGGQSSTLEAISAGVPTIIWQCGIDQIYIANQMSEVYHAAIELVQIRLEHNVGKPTARGVVVKGTDEAIAEELKKAFADLEVGGARREEITANIAKLRDTMEADLKEGGRAYQNLERFVNM